MTRLLLLTGLALGFGLCFGAYPAAAATCDTSWLLPADGSWSDGTKWSNGVPSAADPARDLACITVAGTYTVTINADASAGGLSLGGVVGAQTLKIAPSATDVTLTLAQLSGSDGVLAN